MNRFLSSALLLLLSGTATAGPTGPDEGANKAVAVVQDYYRAMNAAERAKLVADADRLSKCSAFREEPFERFPEAKVELPRTIDGRMVVDVIATPEEKRQRLRHVYLVKDGDRFLVDWEATEERACNAPSLHLLSVRKSGRADVRVFVSLKAARESLAATHWALMLEEGRAKVLVTAYVEKNSDVGRSLMEALKDDGKYPMVLAVVFRDLPAYGGLDETEPMMVVEKVVNPRGWR